MNPINFLYLRYVVGEEMSTPEQQRKKKRPRPNLWKIEQAAKNRERKAEEVELIKEGTEARRRKLEAVEKGVQTELLTAEKGAQTDEPTVTVKMEPMETDRHGEYVKQNDKCDAKEAERSNKHLDKKDKRKEKKTKHRDRKAKRRDKETKQKEKEAKRKEQKAKRKEKRKRNKQRADRKEDEGKGETA